MDWKQMWERKRKVEERITPKEIEESPRKSIEEN